MAVSVNEMVGAPVAGCDYPRFRDVRRPWCGRDTAYLFTSPERITYRRCLGHANQAWDRAREDGYRVTDADGKEVEL